MSHSSLNEESEQSRFHRTVDKYGQQCAEEAGTGLSDDMIPEYQEEFFSIYEEFHSLPDAESAFADSFRSGWDFYRYCRVD